tara:strand:- start:317 stop:538 length:222 start_codon:yes stop_codon:yes gene_type:complete
MKYLILFLVLFCFNAKANANWTADFTKFCKVYMVYVNQFPTSFAAGCCDFNHPSNDRYKIEYLGDKFEEKECV